MTDEQPEQWAVDLAVESAWASEANVHRFAMMIQRAFTERTADLVADNAKLREALDADCTAFPLMEAKLIEVANRISGLKGEPPCHPDPVMVSEWVSEINHAALAQQDKTNAK